MSAADDGAGHNVADELLRIDRLGADRRDRGIGDDPFDASTREGHESNELTARLHVGVAVKRFRNGGESRHRAPDLVDEDGKALRVEARRHAAPRSPSARAPRTPRRRAPDPRTPPRARCSDAGPHPRRFQRRSEHCDAATVRRSSERRAGRTPSTSSPGSRSSHSASDTTGVASIGTASPRRRFSTPRFHGQTS